MRLVEEAMDNLKRKAVELTLTILIIILPFTTQLHSSKALDWYLATQFTADPEGEQVWDMMPSVMQARDGTIWIFWTSDMRVFQHDIYYKTSSDNGLSWSIETLLTIELTTDEHPSAMQARDETIWVVWASERTGNKEIFYKTSSDNGTTWSDAFQLTNNASKDAWPSIAQDINGTIWVVWHRNVEGNRNIFYVTSSDNGLSWSNEERLPTDTSWNINPSITCTGNGTIWVVWAFFNLTESNYELFYKTSSDYGESWSDDTQLTADTLEDKDPSIIQDPAGTIWVFWAKDLDIYYKTTNDYGANWSEDTLFESSSGDDISPSATTTNEKTIWVAWESTRSDFDIYYKISDEIPSIHDIALTDITLWVSGGRIVSGVPRGTILLINVTVENQGNFTETFNVTVYADRNTGDVHVDIGTQYDVSLPGGNTTALTFTWDTIGFPYGTYYISANATIVPYEYDTADNFLINGATLGGITAPGGNAEVSLFVLLAPLAFVVTIVAAFGALAVAFFKLLMGIKPWKPWRRRRRQVQYIFLK